MTALPTSPDADSVHRLYRVRSGRRFGGVAGGLADHLHLPRRWVRLAFIVLAFASGLGILLYAAFWIVLTAAPTDEGEPARRTVLGYLLAIGAIGAVLVTDDRTRPVGWWFTPSVLAVFGAALIWRQASETDRDRWRRLSRSSLGAGLTDRTGRLRLVAGIVLVLAGAAFALVQAGLSQSGLVVAAVIVTLVGVGLITGPWWARLVAELSEERRERIRSEERAELAASVHDSVLQTLALIQRNAGSAREVTRLARRQERQLRALLYEGAPPEGRFVEALRAVAADVEDTYGVRVDAVFVGDRLLSARLDTVVAAAREAMLNAARHSGVETLSLYAEIDTAAGPGTVRVYVRDRGCGFDPADIPADRQGVRGSILARMQRQHGHAEVRASPGAGTEVELTMELT